MNSKKKIVSIATIVGSLALAGAAHGQGRGNGNGGGGGGGNGNGNARGNSGTAPGRVGRPADAGRPADNPGRARGNEGDLPPQARGRGNDAGRGNDRSASPAAQALAARMKEINESSFAARQDILRNLDMSLASSREALRKVQDDARVQRIDARADFREALAEVKARETDLDTEMKRAREAREAGWPASRTGLARALENHANAMGRLEAKLPKLPAPPALPTP